MCIFVKEPQMNSKKSFISTKKVDFLCQFYTVLFSFFGSVTDESYLHALIEFLTYLRMKGWTACLFCLETYTVLSLWFTCLFFFDCAASPFQIIKA